MISVIIPVLNEAKILDQSLSRLIPQLKDHELIIVDGGSTDETPLIAKRYGQVISAERGRARQSNAGAAAARGDILLFLHADVVARFWSPLKALKPQSQRVMSAERSNSGLKGSTRYIA